METSVKTSAKKAEKKKSSKKASKKAAYKRAAKKAAAGSTWNSIQKTPPGFSATTSRLLVPDGHVVEPSKLKKGLARAKDEITELIQEVVDGSTQPYEITEIEFAASFSADGKFMGFGVGGEATITFRIRPTR